MFDEKEAIQKGKEWMRNSKDISHDYTHAENVSKYALEVFRSLKENEFEVDGEVDENLILLSTWWHDCFKSLYSKRKLYNEFVEGVESEKIAQRELENLVEGKRLKMILKSIRVHNNVPYILFKGKNLDTLTRILIEADTIDAQDKERKAKKIREDRTVFHKLGQFCITPVINLLQKIYIKTPYAKIKIKELKNET